MDENDAARTSVAAARDETIIISDDEAEESSSSKGQPQAIFISDDENETSGEGKNNREHDDENDDDSICSAEERDVQFYDDTLPDEEDADFIPDNIDDHADNTDVEMLDYTPPAFVPPPIHFERAAVRLASGSIIAPGNTVELELEDEPTPIANRVQSGDFILVRSILETTEDGLITVRGYRMRRTRYLAPQFDSKLNDLFMNLTVKLNSPLSRFEQGLEDIPLEQVKCKRDCVFTRLDSRSYNSINITRHIPARLRSRQEIRNWLFRRGKLVCRYVNIVELERTDKSYGGEARLLHKREVEAFQNNMPYSPTAAPNKPRPSIRSGRHLTFGDGFSGCGGASEGARQAGFIIKWALERDEQAMSAYRKNFPSATHLHMDAVDFPSIAQRAKHGCDHLHISCPCQPWSCMHTTPGKNDEENTFSLLTVEAWLQKVKPRTFSLEQAPGLLQLAKHRKYFRKLINGIISSGYQVRWGIQNHAWLGLPQHRRRLIIVGSKGTFPLAPFPAATHGPPGSSLRPYVTIADALHPLKSRQVRFPDDPYHQPKSMRPLNRPPINPHANLAKVVTTSGKENAHHSGKRASTVRELAAFQGFPLDFHFTGSTRTATKQCGNAWPPGSNQFYFRVWAAHHEAYNNGMIEDEEEVLDLYDVLARKEYLPIPFDLDADMPDFIYLPNITRTIQPRYPLPVWERNAPRQRAR